MDSLGKSPSVSVVLPHFIFGALSFFVVTLLLLFSTDAFSGHYFHPQLLSITHLAVLGWGVMIVFGSLYQLLPVLLETPLYSENLARITFVFLASGIITIAWSFWNFYVGIQLEIASALLLLAFICFSLNIFLTVRKSKINSTSIDFISTSVIWLLLTGILGFLMAINFTNPFLPKSHLLFLKIHAHIGIAGWFILLIIGVASKLIPMFLLAQNLNQKKLSTAYYLINGGLIAFVVDMLLFEGSSLLPIYAFTIVGGISCFISYIYEAYKKRVRKILDIGLKHTFLAMIVIFLPAIIGILLSFTNSIESPFLLRVYLIYGTAIFLGFISALILGQTFKTLPFIVWLHKFGNGAKKGNAPLPKDLYSENLAKGQLIIYLVGFLLFMIGILSGLFIFIQTGSILLLITALLYNINIFKIIFFKIKT